jgi:hypothetical protein
MNRAWKIVLLFLALVLAFPVPMPCGHVFYSCATAPDPDGTYYTSYEVEPLGITLVETLIGTNLQVYYWSGSAAHSLSR